MNIIAHRGFWKHPEEKNTREAFIRAIELGYGIETDIRDDRGSIVIAHDMPRGDEMPLQELLELAKTRNTLLALNIKSDGLSIVLKELIQKNDINNYFTFDMSFPESRRYVKNELLPYLSMSEFHSLFFDPTEYAGVWLDAFERDWYNEDLLYRWLNKLQDRSICIVSPELHGRDHLPLWNMIKLAKLHKKIAICTDFPDEADKFFNERSI